MTPITAARLAAEYVGVVDEARRVKIAKTEAFYRSVNETIESLNKDFAPILQTMIVICECGDDACAEQLEVDPPLYERVRRRHALHRQERPRDPRRRGNRRDSPAFNIVCKNKGPGAAIARQT